MFTCRIEYLMRAAVLAGRIGPADSVQASLVDSHGQRPASRWQRWSVTPAVTVEIIYAQIIDGVEARLAEAADDVQAALDMREAGVIHAFG